MQSTATTTRREVIPSGQEGRAQGRQGQGQGGPAADAARDRRGEEDRVALLIPTWWERDPDLLAEELRSLRAAGFRIRQAGPVTDTTLAVDLERTSVRYRVVYPSGFPRVHPIAFRGNTLPMAATDERVAGQGGLPGGMGVLALEQLIHGVRGAPTSA